jgi:ABC-type bacteriocin/lantibiotic exporter with double-glycine peptidase domain
VTSFFGVKKSYGEIKSALGTTQNGTTDAAMVKYLRGVGLRVSRQDHMSWRDLVRAIGDGNVVIVGLDGDHVGVVYGIGGGNVFLSDPSPRRMIGRKISSADFKERWMNEGTAVRRR